MRTTLKIIKSHKPCTSGWEELLKGLGTTNLETEVTLEQILDINGVQDAYWVLRCWDYREYCLLLANVAESVIHIFEVKYPEDDRPRKAIQAIRDYYDCKIIKEELIDSHAAAAAAAASAAVYAAASAAAAADAYASAAAASAYAADASAAAAAAYAADAYAATNENQWQKNEELMRSFIDANKEK
jgi:hypothetical protein